MTKTFKIYLRFLHYIAYISGVVLILVGLSFPLSSNSIGVAALKEVDPASLQVTDFTQALLESGNLAGATLTNEARPDEALTTDIYQYTLKNPSWQYAGARKTFFETVFKKGSSPRLEGTEPPSVSTLMTKSVNRQWMQTLLGELEDPLISTVLATGFYRNWKILEPIESSASAPLQTAVIATALLQYEGALKAPILQEILDISANSQNPTYLARLESFYLATLTYTQRLPWNALVLLAKTTYSIDEWVLGSQYMREYPDKTPIIFTSSLMAESLALVVNYINTHEKQKAFEDLDTALNINQSALKTLLAVNKPIFEPRILGFIFTPLSESFISKALSSFCIYHPLAAIKLKYTALLAGCIILVNAIGLSFIKRRHESIAHALQNQPYLNYILTALTVTLMLAFILEPASGLSDETAPPPILIPFSLHDLSYLTQPTIMNTYSLDTATTLTLLGFFLTQAIIYVLCLKKLRQIQERKLSNEKKLKVLENEENLFDLGLYIGLAGTVGSLMLLALGIVGTSLIAAYSSTLFGIISVALIKIIHIRPYRQMLILNIK